MTEIHSVLPGVFALFGFQLFASFNDVFLKGTAPAEKALYLVSQVLLAISAALLLTPAAYHRLVRPHSISDAFANLISHLLKWAMRPLALVFPADGYLVTKIVTRRVSVASAVGVLLFAIFVAAWIVFPRLNRAKLVRRREEARSRGEELAPA